MASSSTTGGHYYFFLVALSLLSSAAAYDGQLSEQFYSKTCPSLNKIIETEVHRALFEVPPPAGDPRMGASLLRLFFHDCFVQGCDGSVLLDNDATKEPAIVSEKTAFPNFKSLRGFDVIDRIKDEVEAACGSGVVSCADIVAIAAKQAVIELGGQGWPLLLGRRDSTTANLTQANSDLPSPSSDLPTLIAAFKKKNFTDKELVQLSGAHTIGKAQCTNVDSSQQTRCINATNNTNNVLLLPLDGTSEKFDNVYYKNLSSNGLLHSDRVLVDSPDLKDLVGNYTSNQNLFFQDFANAMKKMSEMSVLTGTNGQIRLKCNKVNSEY